MKKNIQKISDFTKVKKAEKLLLHLSYTELMRWADSNEIKSYENFELALKTIGVELQMRKHFLFDLS